MNKRNILQKMILQCDCRMCYDLWSEWYGKSEIIGVVRRTSYDGSHLEGKPSMYVEIELGGSYDES